MAPASRDLLRPHSRRECSDFFRRSANAVHARMVSGLITGLLLAQASSVPAVDESQEVTSQPVREQRFAIHGQLTYVKQETNAFSAPYSGPNSLSPSSGRGTVDATLFLGARLWEGAEMWVTPEIDQGFGLDNTLVSMCSFGSEARLRAVVPKSRTAKERGA